MPRELEGPLPRNETEYWAAMPAPAKVTEFFQGGPPAAPVSAPFYSRLIRAVDASPQGRANGARSVLLRA